MIRKFSFGDYAIGLSERYVRHSQKLLDKDDKDFRFLQNSKKLSNGMILIQVKGMKSRFRSGVGRTVFVLFKNGEIEDTLCNCESGQRTIGGCAHGIALLRMIKRQQDGTSGQLYSSKSDKIYDSLTIPNFTDVEYDSDEDEEYKNDYEDDEDSD